MLRRVARKSVDLFGLDPSQVGNYLGLAMKLTAPRRTRLNVGGGPFYKRGWAVLDWSPYARFLPGTVDYKHNLATFDPWPVPDNSMDMAYSSHCFEHIPARFAAHNFAEAFRVLRPGGIFRITTPCFDRGFAFLSDHHPYYLDPTRPLGSWLSYFGSGYWGKLLAEDEIAAHIGTRAETLEWIDDINPTVPEDWTRREQDHVSVWFSDRHREHMDRAGFIDFREAQPGDNPDMQGRNIGWAFDHRFPEGSVFVEARKP